MAGLDGKVAIVTGGSLGIGRAAAARLAAEGAAVMICGSDAAHLEEGLGALRRRGDVRVDGVVADVAVASEVDTLVATTVERFGGVDILVNSAGIQRYGSSLDTDEAMWDRVMDVNVKSMYLTAGRVVPEMRRRGGGSIVNVSSVQAFIALRNSLAYVTSKGAINSLTRALALDHAPDNIRVNAVCPGSIDTPMLRWAADLFKEGREADDLIEEWGRMHPLGRVGTAEEVGAVIAFLAGSDASFVTGAAIPVDGGLLLTVSVAVPASQA